LKFILESPGKSWNFIKLFWWEPCKTGLPADLENLENLENLEIDLFLKKLRENSGRKFKILRNSGKTQGNYFL